MLLVLLVVAGLVVGVAYGTFGAGGSAFATPILVLAGLSPIAAIATPLPALLPASVAGAVAYRNSSALDWVTARRTLVGAVPAALLGAGLSRHVDGRLLLVLSAVVLAIVGAGLVWPRLATAEAGADAGAEASTSATAGRPAPATWIVVTGGAAVGFFTGLLANGGGFLLVPFFALALGMSMRRAAGTSLVTVAVLAVPTTLAHWLSGNIDWPAAAAFAAGLAPATVVGTHLSGRLQGRAARITFGAILIVFAGLFAIRLAR